MLHESARCSDLVDKRFSAKATGRLLFALTKSQRATTCQNATQHWLDLHLQRQPLIPLHVSETWQAKDIVKAFCYLLCTRYFLYKFAPILQCTGRPGSIVHHRCIALQHATMRVNSMLHAEGHSRSRKIHARRSTQLSRPRDIMHASWAGDFFFFGSADPRILEYSNGSLADPDRSGFRWIRFTPSFNTHKQYAYMCKECLCALFCSLFQGNKTSEGCSLDRVRSKIGTRKTMATPAYLTKTHGQQDR